MNSEITVRRQTMLKLLRGVDIETADKMILGLWRLAGKLGDKSGADALVFLSYGCDLSVSDIQPLVDQQAPERIHAAGVHTLVRLYQAGFFTGSAMPEPVMLTRIRDHLQEQLVAA